jgi:D-3-phosphoglycerate dehydrogenase
MTNAIVESLILDLLEWICRGGKTYDEVMEAWRTSCSKLPVWEEANDLGLLAKEPTQHGCIVRITLLGFLFLRERRPVLMQAA